MSERIYAPTQFDAQLDRVPPDVTDVVNKAKERLVLRWQEEYEADPNVSARDSIDGIVETETEAIAEILWDALEAAAEEIDNARPDDE